MFRISGLHIPRVTLSFLIADSVMVLAGLTGATALASLLAGAMPRQSYGAETVARFLLVMFVWDVALYYNELYSLRLPQLRRSETFIRVLQASGMSCVALAVLYFLVPYSGIGRKTAVLAGPIIPALLISCRLLLDQTGPLMGRPERVLIVGTAEAGVSLVREIIGRPHLNLNVVGFLDERGENLGKSLVNPGIVGAVRDVEEIVAKEKIDRVVLSLEERRGCTPVHQLLRLKLAGVRVEEVHSIYEKLTGRILLDRLPPSSLILSDGFRKSGFLTSAKRGFDIAVSLVALLVAWPLMGAPIALAIWLETGGPIFFRQKRVGLWGRDFEMLKFRSMYKNAEVNGPVWAVDGDGRVTRVGRLIRRYRFDELPQFLNVLRGEMSLVGPRPERPHFATLLEASLPLFSARHSVRPGITGWAQIKYQYGSSIEDAEQKLQLDLFYIKNLSVILDMAIISETFKVMVLARGAR